MGKNGRNLTLRVRYRDGFNVRSRLVFGDKKRAARSLGKGKILRIEKVSEQELHHVGEYNDLPTKLMKEFQSKKNGESIPVDSGFSILDKIGGKR